MKAKKKILIPLVSNFAIRNFVESNAFADLEKEYELVFVVNEYATKKISSKNVYYLENKEFSTKNASLAYQGCLSMRRYKNRCSTFPIKFKGFYWNRFSKKNKLRTWFLSLPLVYEVYLFFYNSVTWNNKRLEKVIIDETPDFCFIPSNYSESFSYDTISICKKLEIPCMMFMLNWDNISCKGVVPIKPDYMGVWGEQSKKHAIEIHDTRPENVFKIGSPQFEVYNDIPSKERIKEFKKESLNLDEDTNYLVFVGVARYRDEMSVLSHLDSYIDDEGLESIRIIYRPHPSKEWRKDEKNFFDYSFKNILLDPQVKEHYTSTIFEKSYNYAAFTPDSDYYPLLLNGSIGMITSLSTLSLEAMLIGKPILQLAYPDQKYKYSFDKLRRYSHHDCWDSLDAVFFCEHEEDISPLFQKLINIGLSKRHHESLKERSTYVVKDNRNTSFSKKLAQTLNRIL